MGNVDNEVLEKEPVTDDNVTPHEENEAENVPQDTEHSEPEGQQDTANNGETAVEGGDDADNDGDNDNDAENAADDEAETDNSAAENAETAPAEDAEDAPEKKKGVLKKILIAAGSVLAAAALIYLGGAFYYSSHFFYGTYVGSFNCSNMSAEAARSSIQNDIDNYSFTFYEKDGATETINGSDIYLECGPVKNLDSLVEDQNSFLWPVSFEERDLPLDVDVTYNEDSLYNLISEMDFMADTRAAMEGSSSKIVYSDGAYTVEDDEEGNIVSLNDIFHKVQPKISDLYLGMSMEKEGCYTGLAGDDTMKGVLNLLNQYVGTVVTYKNGDKTTVLDASTINEWLSVGDDYSVNIDKEKVKSYIDELAKTYDTAGKERTFKTNSGSEIKISGGNYGWVVNNQKETEELLNIIRSGETVEREPVYKQTAKSHDSNDIGNTYAEVSLSAQHVWYYKNGELLVSSDVVTGNTSRGNGTPSGVYYIVYKGKNVVLRGPGYASPVTYWMPFNGGIGFHDATWRSSFGGSIYRSGGSHGCVNMPKSAAEKLFGVISSGDPVVVY